VPVILAVEFRRDGAWGALPECVICHYFLWQMHAKHHAPWTTWIFPVGCSMALAAARLISKSSSDRRICFRRVFVFLICGTYLPILYSFWRFVTRQDYLPLGPLVFVFASAAILAIS